MAMLRHCPSQDMKSTNSMTKNYKLVKPLVQGSQASIELWSHITTGELVAVKTSHAYTPLQLQLGQIKLNNRRNLQNLDEDPLSTEANILAKLQQNRVPGIVPFKGTFDTQIKKTNHKIISKKHIVLGYCDGGDLFDLVNSRPDQKLNEYEACKIIKSLVHTLKCCHELGIMHRDIKLENVFLMSKTSSNKSNNGHLQYTQFNTNTNNYNNIDHNIVTNSNIGLQNSSLSKRKATSLADEFDHSVLLGDFGLATCFKKTEDGSSIRNVLSDSVGSLCYMAPEVIRGKYDERADVWSLGVVLNCLLTGSFPFSDFNDNEAKIKSQILKQDLDVVGSPEYLELSSSACDLLTQMLDKNPNTRITLEGIQNHTWLSQCTSDESSSSSCRKRIRKM